MATFHSRRDLTPRQTKTALGAAVGAGVAVALVTGYLARIWLQKTPVRPREAQHTTAAGVPRVAEPGAGA